MDSPKQTPYISLEPAYTFDSQKRGQEDAVPLGRHRNARENTLGTLYSNIAPRMLDLQGEIM